MKEMLMVYQKARYQYETVGGIDRKFIYARYHQLIGMLEMMKLCGIMTADESYAEMLDLIEIRENNYKGCER